MFTSAVGNVETGAKWTSLGISVNTSKFGKVLFLVNERGKQIIVHLVEAERKSMVTDFLSVQLW